MGELALLREVQAALRRGDPARALNAIDSATRSDSPRVLEEEFAVARVLALCDLGRVSDAQRAADAFLSRFAQSPLAARVSRSCAYARRDER